TSWARTRSCGAPTSRIPTVAGLDRGGTTSASSATCPPTCGERSCATTLRSSTVSRTAGEETTMKTHRLYTGPDGHSHIESFDLGKKPDWAKGLPTTQISFREWPRGEFIDWHPAPRRQFVIILSGQLEIGLGDGSKHVFGPGDVLGAVADRKSTRLNSSHDQSSYAVFCLKK